MPSAALYTCLDCNVQVPRGNPRCLAHAQKKEQSRDNVEVRRWYRTARWRNQVRPYILSRDPLCMCETCKGKDARHVSEDVDHIEKHHGDPVKFWDTNNLQGLSHAHHTVKTARGE